jgi:hypothetical protein
MKAAAFLVTATILATHPAHGRLFQIVPPAELVAKSRLVFLGRVNSVRPSGITTRLSYVPWHGATFHWMVAEVQVIEAFKGTQKGQTVQVATLSIDEDLANPPFMLRAEKGDVFFFCVLPTPATNLFAALTAPNNESLSVIALHRATHSAEDVQSSTEATRDFNDKLLWDDKRFSPIFDLVDGSGRVVAGGPDRLRSTFAAELATGGLTNVMYLEWETAVSLGGWQSDAPKGVTNWTGSNDLSGAVYTK